MPELPRDDYTRFIQSLTCDSEPINPATADDLIEGINRAIELEERPVLLEGLSARLTELGVPCTSADTDTMLTEVKRRYKDILGKSCPRTVQEWIRGTTPGVTNRLNNYDLCYALEVDFQQTAIFFQKHYLTIPFNVKSRTDAVFLYCLYQRKPYSVVTEMLDSAKGFVSQENAHTSTSQIFTAITAFDDDAAFLRYLSAHCYDNEQQFQLARRIINNEIEQVKARILSDMTIETVSPKRLNSLTIAQLLGYRYQLCDKNNDERKLPKHFTESLPNDVNLGKIINGDSITYEVLRKALMLLRFYNFYSAAENVDTESIRGNLMDFYEELNNTLISCGFSQIYVRHPFDCLLLYCANSYDPILSIHLLNERN